MAETIKVKLAEVPTDVLVVLADADLDTSMTIAGIAARLEREDDSETRGKIGNAVRLLVDGGWAEFRSIEGMVMVRATGEGREEIAAARAAVGAV